ncbi:hypothetical protein GJ496_002941 [Pomphorhynchus laevis]|nr:hypothetical protein GJ496_002941 [Pomphorhynchus laevis]
MTSSVCGNEVTSLNSMVNHSRQQSGIAHSLPSFVYLNYLFLLDSNSIKSLNLDRQHIFCTVCLHNLLLTISNRLSEFKECAAKRDYHVNESQAHVNRQYSDNEIGVYEDSDTILINDSNTVHYSNDKEDLSLIYIEVVLPISIVMIFFQL